MENKSDPVKTLSRDSTEEDQELSTKLPGNRDVENLPPTKKRVTIRTDSDPVKQMPSYEPEILPKVKSGPIPTPTITNVTGEARTPETKL